MASVFTYDPDPPRISSPWSDSPVSTPRLRPVKDTDCLLFGGLPAPTPSLLEESGISKLNAEPQDGPTEYKLHLLLRPRKTYAGVSLPVTGAGLQQMKSRGSSITSGMVSNLAFKTNSGTPPLQARQKRLEHLTTQLLWRLQQSSPYHAQSTLKLAAPALPEAGPLLTSPAGTGKLLPGLEESRGALYEIGVADDGAFIGLTKEEMDESLINLRSMAASLGCKVEILRTVIVGEYEIDASSANALEKLWVVEALVLPDTHGHTVGNAPVSPLAAKVTPSNDTSTVTSLHNTHSRTEQLRVSLTGSTTSGKSSLVGTLSTSTLDSGRGKTRLSLLKHRHEIESGITSSVAPELIGYHTSANGDGLTQVVNYGFGNVSTWNDIHNATEGERLVFLLDSAGHPRYRRTTVRGLVSWAPHWTLCCVAAEEAEDAAPRPGSNNPAEDIFGTAGGATDLSRAHLELCLKLDLRVIVVITKLDYATNAGLRNTLSKILSTVKAAGRNPVLLKPDSSNSTGDELQTLSVADIAEVKSIFFKHDPGTIVPVVLTSAVKGSGIRKLHALLSIVPIADEQTIAPGHSDASAVFHIDEVFSKPAAAENQLHSTSSNILSGHLCYQDLEVGDRVLIGPCMQDINEIVGAQLSRARSYPSRISLGAIQDLSRSAPKVPTLVSLDEPSTRRSASDTHTPVSTTSPEEEWVPAQINSIRNLRLPLRRLLAGQVGTIGLNILPTGHPKASNHRLRKGMVLVKNTSNSFPPRACSGLKVTVASEAYNFLEPGALFTIYVNSIRASAKITSVELPASYEAMTTSVSSTAKAHLEADDTVFEFDDPDSIQPEVTFSSNGRREVRYQPPLSAEVDVSLSLIGGREWIQVGDKILIMPTAVMEGGSGLDGIVVSVREVF